MVAIDRMLRTLGATVTFAATAALLVYPLSREISKSARLQNAFSHSPSTASEFVNLSVSDTDHVQPLAVPFGREYFNADFSSSVWVKRAPTGSLTYEAAVCNGGRFWTQIQEAFNGNRPPGPVFSIESVGNGWSTMRDQKALESHWDGALNMMARALGISNDDPHPGFDYIEVSQDEPFDNTQGQRIEASFLSTRDSTLH